jgi:hypothetical protein
VWLRSAGGRPKRNEVLFLRSRLSFRSRLDGGARGDRSLMLNRAWGSGPRHFECAVRPQSPCAARRGPPPSGDWQTNMRGRRLVIADSRSISHRQYDLFFVFTQPRLPGR